MRGPPPTLCGLPCVLGEIKTISFQSSFHFTGEEQPLHSHRQRRRTLDRVLESTNDSRFLLLHPSKPISFSRKEEEESCSTTVARPRSQAGVTHQLDFNRRPLDHHLAALSVLLAKLLTRAPPRKSTRTHYSIALKLDLNHRLNSNGTRPLILIAIEYLSQIEKEKLGDTRFHTRSSTSDTRIQLYHPPLSTAFSLNQRQERTVPQPPCLTRNSTTLTLRTRSLIPEATRPHHQRLDGLLDYIAQLLGFTMSNYTGGSSMDSDYNVDEAESWSSRPAREQQDYESLRRRAEIAHGKRAMSEEYELMDEDLENLEDEYVPEHSRRETKLLNKPDELPVEEYIRLFNLNEFCGTRYPCLETLKKLGFQEDVEHLFQSCHLDTLMSYPFVAYEDETIQLLSSLQVEIYQGMTVDELESEGLGFITFTVYGQNYKLSIQRLEGLFGFPSGMGTKQRFDRSEMKDLWLTIGSTAALNSSRSKSNQIRSPIMRYFQCSIAHVLYSREIIGTVTNTDMEMISMALKGTLHRTKSNTIMHGDTSDTPLVIL
ncbi:unnamed protein product, partial [Arabidopsis halleri]